MKLASNELPELIDSLSEKEKKDFLSWSMRANHQQKADYLVLFKSYATQKKKDDKTLKEKLKLKNFERIKHYLHKRVLAYMAENSPENSQKEIMNLILVGDALTERSLLKQALQAMEKARKLCIRKQLPNFQLIVEEKIHEIQSGLGDQKYFDYFVSTYHNKEFKAIIRNIEEDQESRTFLLKRRLFSAKNNALMRSKESIAELKQTFEHYVNTAEKRSTLFATRSRFYITAAYYYQQLGNSEKALHYFKLSADSFQEDNPNPSENYINYAIALHNLMFTHARVQNFTEVRKVLDVLHGIKPRTKQHRIAMMQSYVAYESLYCKHHPNYTLRRKALREVETYVIKSSKAMSLQLYLTTLINLSVNYFIDSNFKKALEIINKTDELESSPFFKDHLSVVKIYKLVVYYELGKLDLLSFALRNTYRYMLKHMQYYAFEKEVIRALKQIINVSSIKTQNKIWEETRINLLRLKDNADAAQVFLLFNFTGWIECRVKRKSYENLMNEL